MPDRDDQMVLKFREVLAATETLPPDDLIAYQRKLLTPLLLHARSHVPFYKTRLAPLFRGNDIDFDRWSDIQIVTRAEAQTATSHVGQEKPGA